MRFYDISQSAKGARNVKPEHFFDAFEHCLKIKASKSMAMIMAKGFKIRGFIDACEGCMHYTMRLM